MKKSQLKNYLVISLVLISLSFFVFFIKNIEAPINPADYLVMVNNTPYCIQCFTEYDVINPTPSNLAVPPNFVQWLGKQTTYNKKILYYANESYFYQEWISNITCSPYQKTVNWTFTEQNCTDNGKLLNHSGNITKLKPFIASEIDKNTKLRIRVEGSLKPNSYDDNIIFFNNYNYTEYAIWNASSGGRTTINITREVTQNYTDFDFWIPINTSMMDGSNGACEAQIRVFANNTPIGEESEVTSASPKGNTTHCQVWWQYNITIPNATYIFNIYYNNSFSKPDYSSATGMTLLHSAPNKNDTIQIEDALIGQYYNFTLGSAFIFGIDSPTVSKQSTSLIVFGDGGDAKSGACSNFNIEYNSSALIIMNTTGCESVNFRYYFTPRKGYFKSEMLNSIGSGGMILEQIQSFRGDTYFFLNATPINGLISDSNFSLITTVASTADIINFGFAGYNNNSVSHNFFMLKNYSYERNETLNKSSIYENAGVSSLNFGTRSAAAWGLGSMNFSNSFVWMGFMQNMSRAYFWRQIMTPISYIPSPIYEQQTTNIAPIVRNISISPTIIYKNTVVNVTFNLTDDTNTTFNVTVALYRNGVMNFTYTNMTYRANTSMTINATSTTWAVDDKLYWNLTSSDGTDNSGINTTATITVLNRLPIINLSSPANSTQIANLPNVTFSYNYSDADSDISICNITLNNNLINSTNASDGQQVNYTYSFSTNNYSMTWNVTCWDNYNRTWSNNYNVSLVRDNIAQNASITLSTTTIESHYESLEINISCGDANTCYFNITNSDGTLLTKANNLSVFDLLISYDNQTVLGNATVWVVSNDTLNNKNITSKQYNLTDTNTPVINSVNRVPTTVNMGNNITIYADIVEAGISIAYVRFKNTNYESWKYNMTKVSGNNYSVTIETNTSFPTTVNFEVYVNDTINQNTTSSSSFAVHYPNLPSFDSFAIDNQYVNTVWTLIANITSETMLKNVTINMTASNGSMEFNKTFMTKMSRVGNFEQWNITYYNRVNGTFIFDLIATNSINNATLYSTTLSQNSEIIITPSYIAKQVIGSKTELMETIINVYSDDVKNFRFNATFFINNKSEMFTLANITPNNATLNWTNSSSTQQYILRVQGNESASDGEYRGNITFTLLETGVQYVIQTTHSINPPAAEISLTKSDGTKCDGNLGLTDTCFIYESSVTQNINKIETLYVNNSGGFNATGCSLFADGKLKDTISSPQFNVSLNSTTSIIMTFNSPNLSLHSGKIFVNCTSASSLGFGQTSNNSLFAWFVVVAPATPSVAGGGGGGNVVTALPNETITGQDFIILTTEDNKNNYDGIFMSSPSFREFRFTVTNNGSLNSTYSMDFFGESSWIQYVAQDKDGIVRDRYNFFLIPTASKTIYMNITIPENVDSGEFANAIIIKNQYGTIHNLQIKISIGWQGKFIEYFNKWKGIKYLDIDGFLIPMPNILIAFLVGIVVFFGILGLTFYIKSPVFVFFRLIAQVILAIIAFFVTFLFL